MKMLTYKERGRKDQVDWNTDESKISMNVTYYRSDLGTMSIFYSDTKLNQKGKGNT